MTRPPLKFRCSGCSQLLGVALEKAGKMVRCPKCAVDVLVPDDSSSLPETSRADVPVQQVLNELDLDPGDLRSMLPTQGRKSRPTRGPIQASVRPWPALLEETDSDTEVGQRFSVSTEQLTKGNEPPLEPSSQSSLLPQTEIAPAAKPKTIDDDSMAKTTEASALVSTPEPLALPTQRNRATRDVVMPRFAVVCWSLFAMLALFMTFVAGVMIGHFVWIQPS